MDTISKLLDPQGPLLQGSLVPRPHMKIEKGAGSTSV